MPKARIAVAMSGGVDSSVVAGLLREQGYEIIGLTMQLWNQRRLPELLPDHPVTGRCCSLDDVYDARQVAMRLGIPHYVVNFEDRFEEKVVKPFISEYMAGRTPIPCALCNNFIKFDQFLEMAAGVDAGQIATGHYARLDFDQATGRHRLWRGRDASKDQTYFLFGLTQAQLSRTLFPLGNFTKPEVREIAARFGLPVASKGDSQEICFVPDGNYARFIEAYMKEQSIASPDTGGEIVTTNGKVIGEHSGVQHFTIGQRRGLGVAAAQPLYVIATDAASRQVFVGANDELLRDSLMAREVNWVSIAPIEQPVSAQVKIRNKHIPAAATLLPTADAARVEVRFDEPQRAVTPGQAAVFYDGDLVLAGGWIE